MQAFGIPDQGSTIAQRGVIYKQALALVRSFGVEPIKHAVASQATNWDLNSQYGLSYRQVVLTGNLYPPCVAGPSPGSSPSTTFLQMIEAGILNGSVPAGAWIYLYDEPTAGQMADLIAQAKIVRANAPHLKIMVTTTPTAALAGLVDYYVPIFESYGAQAPQAGVYGSCTSAGTCSNWHVGTPTGTPMLALDVDPVNWVAYPVVAKALGASFGLYYDLDYSIKTALNPAGQYFFGNNGDGNLLYVGTNNTVWPSARLLAIKRGLARVARGAPYPVTDAKHWSHVLSDYGSF